MKDKLTVALAVIPVILLSTLMDTFIATNSALLVFVQLTISFGWNRTASIAVAVFIAIAIYAYIRLQPQIRNYITRR